MSAWKYTKLSETLAGLYYKTAEIIDLIIRADLNPSRFDLNNTANVTWTLLIRTVENMGKISNLLDAAIDDYPENQVLLDYKNEKATISKSVYSGDEPSWKAGPAKTTLEKIISSQNTLLPVHFLELGTTRSSAVARVITPDALGSGFLISPDDLFLTNYHVLGDKEYAKRTEVQFNYQQNVNGTAAIPENFTVDISVYETSIDDDWTVVKLNGNPAKKYGHISLGKHTVAKDDFVNIIQHPGGGFKKICIYNNVVKYADANIIQYLTDTMPGSSGSPVFNSNWDIVALHHSGGFIREPNSEIIEFRNEGININKIREELIARKLIKDGTS